MATYTKQLLSQSLSGGSIVMPASATTTIHFTNSSFAITDEVWLYATNTSAYDNLFTLYYGGSSNSNILFNGVIEAYAGSVLICPGLVATGNNITGFPIYGFSSLSGINIFGYVNRIS